MFNVQVNNFPVMDEATSSWVLQVPLWSKCLLPKETTQQPELGSNPVGLAPESDALATRPAVPATLWAFPELVTVEVGR